ncbi:histidine kinase [Oleiharenicola lentus]|uniref:sensor histidine kinase n=1 Tax=Oleiharenicola lentus TaxID=2508720 RepID=UPI003F67706F
MKFLRIYPLVLWFALAASLARAEAPDTRELGLPFFEVFRPRDYHGHGQVWAGGQDRAGLLYFGNYGRVLVYDGARWTQLPVPGATYVRALALDETDTLWLGAVDELGYAKTDATGLRTFVSLKEKLPEAARACGEIWKVFLTPHGPLFQTSTWLMRWDGTKFATLKLPEASSWQMIQVQDRVLLNQAQQGLFLFSDDGTTLAISPTHQPDALKKRGLTFSIHGHAPGETLLGSARTGIISWIGENAQLFVPSLSAELAKHLLYGGARLSDGRLILTTLQDGAYVCDAQGRLLAHLNQSSGLPSNTVINVFVDRSGSAWLCLDQGLVRIDARPWLTWFSPANGAPRSSLSTPVRFENQLYVASGAGLLKLAPAAGLKPARLEAVEGFTDFLNHLVVADDKLIAFGVQGVFSWRPGQPSVTLPGKSFNVDNFVASRRQPARWFAIADGNLYTYRREGATWIEEGTVPGLHNLGGLFEQDDGTWWFGSAQGGALRVKFPHPSATSPGKPVIERFAENAGLPAGFGWVRVSPVGDRVLFQCELGLFRLNPATDRVEPTTELGPRFTEGTWTPRSLTPDPRGGAWVAAKRVGEAEISSATEIGLADATSWHPLVLPPVEQLNDIDGMKLEPGDGATREDLLWISGHSGLIRVDLGAWRRAGTASAPDVVIREITTNDGARLDLTGGWELPFAQRTLTFTFAAPAGANVIFETILSGAGQPLVQTAALAQRTFTGLGAGDYQLQFRARTEGGTWSPPLVLHFHLQPPWWFSPWAWTIYVVIAAGLMVALVRWRTRALRQQAAALEATVAHRTEELRRSNAELTRLNQLELDEKIAAKLGEEKARLEVLRYQLNPHFLFNALTSVCSHLPPGLAKAREIVEQLVDFCQLTLFRPAGGDNPTVAQEMKMLKAYLDIEQTRWGELLSVELTVAPDAAGEKIPPLLLLPLVENALKYGRLTSQGPLQIQLHARRDPQGALEIVIANTGDWVEPGRRGIVPSLGIGLENLRERLQRYYPHAHEFHALPRDGWVTFTLRLNRAAREI